MHEAPVPNVDPGMADGRARGLEEHEVSFTEARALPYPPVTVALARSPLVDGASRQSRSVILEHPVREARAIEPRAGGLSSVGVARSKLTEPSSLYVASRRSFFGELVRRQRGGRGKCQRCRDGESHPCRGPDPARAAFASTSQTHLALSACWTRPCGAGRPAAGRVLRPPGGPRESAPEGALPPP